MGKQKSYLQTIISVVIVVSVYGVYNQCQKDKREVSNISYYKFQQKEAALKAYLDSLKYFDIDSLNTALKADKEINIKYINFDKKDSNLMLIVNPNFDYTNKPLCEEYYTKFYQKHTLRYSSNIAGITILRTFPAKAVDSPTFINYVLWVAAKPYSTIYNQWKDVNPNMTLK